MMTCTADQCVGLLSEADLLASRAREAHTFAGVSRDPEDRAYARDLEARSAVLYDHVLDVHPDYLPEPGEY